MKSVWQCQKDFKQKEKGFNPNPLIFKSNKSGFEPRPLLNLKVTMCILDRSWLVCGDTKDSKWFHSIGAKWILCRYKCSKGPRWQSGNTLASHLWGRGVFPSTASSGKAGSCLPLVGSLQYRTLTNCMYWFPLPFQLPVVIWPVQCWKRRKTPNKYKCSMTIQEDAESVYIRQGKTTPIWLMTAMLKKSVENSSIQGPVSRRLLWKGPPLVKEGHFLPCGRQT